MVDVLATIVVRNNTSYRDTAKIFNLSHPGRNWVHPHIPLHPSIYMPWGENMGGEIAIWEDEYIAKELYKKTIIKELYICFLFNFFFFVCISFLLGRGVFLCFLFFIFAYWFIEV